MLALTTQSVTAVAVAVTVINLLLVYVAFKFVKAATTKAVIALVLGGLILGVWSQRNEISKCKKDILSGHISAKTCDFFGVWKVKIPGL